MGFNLTRNVIIIALLSISYFIVSAWDDYLDGIIEKKFGLSRNRPEDRFRRAIIATLIALAILWAINLDIGEVFGLEPKKKYVRDLWDD